MDFSFSEEQEAVRDLARQILGERFTHERLKEFEAGTELVDRDTWAELAKANLLGIALPEDVGGSGLGLIEVYLILEQIGRTAAPLPVLPTIVMGALPIAAFGSPEQRAQHQPAVVAGDLILSAALVEFGADPARPTTAARPDGGGRRLDGRNIRVPAGRSHPRPRAYGRGHSRRVPRRPGGRGPDTRAPGHDERPARGAPRAGGRAR